MGGAKLCAKTIVHRIDLLDRNNWSIQENGEILTSQGAPKEIVVKKVNTPRKKIAKVKVGNRETEMFTKVV